jgi:integrase
MGPALNAAELQPAATADILILRNRPIQAATPPEHRSRYGDAVWHLRPAHPDADKVVNAVHWARWPPALVPAFKAFAQAALDHPRPATATLVGGGEPLAIATVSLKLRALRVFAQWLDQQGFTRIPDLTEADLDRYRAHVLALSIPQPRQATLLAAVRTWWEYRIVLPPAYRPATADPWHGTRGKQPARGAENRTPRIAADTMQALLAWSLRMVEDIGPDVLAAREEFRQLHARTHPSQDPYRGLGQPAALRLFLEHAARQGRALPGRRGADGTVEVNWSHLGRLLAAGDVNRPELRQQVRDSGLPVAPDTYLGAVTGLIDGRPWRETPIAVSDLPALALHLSAACFTLVSYLSGLRPGEALNLRRGCRRRDEATGLLFVDGRHGKGAARTPRAPVGQDPWARSWVVVQPVHDAIAVLEALTDAPYLFPSSPIVTSHQRPASRHARVSRHMTRDLTRFIDWLNQTFAQPDGGPVVPPDPARHIHPSRFRRTLAHFIVRRPRGLIAAALQYAHVSTKVTLSYAGQADTTWLEDLAVERLELIVEQTEQDHTLLSGGEHVSGPAAAEYRTRVTHAHRFAGRAVHRVRNVERFLASVDPSIHHGEGMTCVWRPETAACHATKLAQHLPAGDAPDETECQTGCPNRAYTDRDITQLRERLTRLQAAADDVLTPRPLRDRAAAQATQLRQILDHHDTDQAPEVSGTTETELA